MKKCVLAGRRVTLIGSVLLAARLASAQTATDYHMPVVTIRATDPFAAESGDTATFEVDRDGPTNATLNVFYQIAGTASNGVDYATLSHWVAVPAGVRSASITIDPVGDTSGETNEEGTKTIVLELTPSPLMIPINYLIGYPSKAVAFLFDDDASSNRPPAVAMIQPKDGAQFYGPTDISISAAAGDWDGWVTNVEFFAGTNDLGPGGLVSAAGLAEGVYSLTWSNAPLGSYALTAVATDNRGAFTVSDPVNITVLQGPPPTNLPPVVSIVIPTNGESFATPVNIPIFARADDPDGYVKTVEFFEGTNSLGKVSIGPITPLGGPVGPILPSWPGIIWSNVPPGSYVLTAVATDNGGASSTSAPVDITVIEGRQTNLPPIVSIIEPANGAVFYTPTNIQMLAKATDLDGSVTNVEFLAGTNDLGAGSPVVLDPPGVSGVTGLVYLFNWLNPSPGNYPLTAVATDNEGESSTSAPVDITVTQGPPPTNLPPVVEIFSPTNGQRFFTHVVCPPCATNNPPCDAPCFLEGPDISICASANDADGYVATVEFFANGDSLGIRTNCLACANPINPFCLFWTNVPGGDYTLTAVATDNGGLSSTSAPVDITVLQGPPSTNQPAVVRIISPANDMVFRAPINLPLFVFFAYPHVPNEFGRVGFYDGTNFLGVAQPVATPPPMPGGPTPDPIPVRPTPLSTNIYELVWTNVPVGNHLLTAQAEVGNLLNGAILRIVSAPVHITVLPPLPPPTNRPPIVSIVASDPVAIEGTNCWVWRGMTNSPPTWAAWRPAACVWFTNCGPKNAVFTVRRWGSTNQDLTLAYDVAGTASNGVDYLTLPGLVTIPAGERDAMITVVPIDDGPPNINSSVILKLDQSTNTPPDYVLGFPRKAAAMIHDSDGTRPLTGMLPGDCFHVSAVGPDGAWFRVEYSTNLTDWTGICTNQIVDGSVDFVDPDAQNDAARFYRIVPEDNPPPP